MSNKREIMTAVRNLNASVRELEQAALGTETQLELLVEQGRTNGKELGALIAAVGTLTSRLGHYLEDSDKQGARIAALERAARVER